MSEYLCGFVCFYSNKRWETYASSMWEAKKAAILHFKAPKSKEHMISVVLAEKDGKQITHSTGAL